MLQVVTWRPNFKGREASYPTTMITPTRETKSKYKMEGY